MPSTPPSSGELIAPARWMRSKRAAGTQGPTATPIGKGFRSINVQLRQRFSTYANLRPVHTLPGVPTALTMWTLSSCARTPRISTRASSIC